MPAIPAAGCAAPPGTKGRAPGCMTETRKAMMERREGERQEQTSRQMQKEMRGEFDKETAENGARGREERRLGDSVSVSHKDVQERRGEVRKKKRGKSEEGRSR